MVCAHWRAAYIFSSNQYALPRCGFWRKERLFYLISNGEVHISLNQCLTLLGTSLEVLSHDRVSKKVSILLTQMHGEMQAPLRKQLWYFISSSTEEDTDKVDHPPPTQREVIPVQLKDEFDPVYTRLLEMPPREQVELFQINTNSDTPQWIRGTICISKLHSRIKLNILINFENQHAVPPQETSYKVATVSVAKPFLNSIHFHPEISGPELDWNLKTYVLSNHAFTHCFGGIPQHIQFQKPNKASHKTR